MLADLESKGQNAEQYQEETPIGSGPFKYVQLGAGAGDYPGGGAGSLQCAEDRQVDPARYSERLRIDGRPAVGEINFLSDYTGDPELLNQTIASASDMLKLVSTTQVGFRFLAPNHRRQPMNDPAFRLAISMAVGKDQIVANIYKGFAQVGGLRGLRRHSSSGAPDLDDYAASDIEGARSVLQAAGYSWTTGSACSIRKASPKRFTGGRWHRRDRTIPTCSRTQARRDHLTSRPRGRSAIRHASWPHEVPHRRRLRTEDVESPTCLSRRSPGPDADRALGDRHDPVSHLPAYARKATDWRISIPPSLKSRPRRSASSLGSTIH